MGGAGGAVLSFRHLSMEQGRGLGVGGMALGRRMMGVWGDLGRLVLQLRWVLGGWPVSWLPMCGRYCGRSGWRIG